MAKDLGLHGLGADTGRLVVYFHGAPGAPAECARFDELARRVGVRLVGLDRARIDPRLKGEAYFRAVAERIDVLAAGAPFDIVAFSLGAFVAIRTARHLTGRLETLHLVCAAAPLESGDFLVGMAGAPVFRLAARSPKLFRGLTWLQGRLAAVAPGRLFRLLFATAAGDDLALAADRRFRAEMAKVLKSGLGPGGRAYARDVLAYVRPWSDEARLMTAKTRLWHGRADNWSPVEMAATLARLLPNVADVTLADGLSHYSCLHHALGRVIEGASGEPGVGA